MRNVFLTAAVCLFAFGTRGRCDEKTLRGFMEDAGKRLDCYFTVEFIPTDVNDTSIVGRGMIAWTTFPQTQDEMRRLIEQQFPQYKVMVASNSSRLVRIVDQRLLDRTTPLDLVRGPIKFEGTLSDFHAELEKTFGGFALPTSITFSDSTLIGIDAITRIRIPQTTGTARELLTAYTPWSDCRHLLWFASVDPEKNNVWVRFGGRAVQRQVKLDPRVTNKPVSFTRGEAAYVWNKALPDSGEAQEFIKGIRHDAVPLNWRWAAKYLGERRRTEAIPDLIRLLDVKYDRHGILSEAFPAAGALSAMGTDAIEPVLAAMKDETDPCRLELLARVLRAVVADTEEQKVFEKQFAASRDSKNAKEILSAWERSRLPLLDAKSVCFKSAAGR